MTRIIKEQIDFTGEEKGKYDFVIGMLVQLCETIKKEEGFATLSDLYIDTEHLIKEMDKYVALYYKP